MLHISGYLHWLASLFVFKALEFSTYWILMVRTSFNFSNFHYKFQIFTIGTSSWIWLQIQILCHFKLQVNDDRITWHASEEPIFSIISFWSSKTRIKDFQCSVCKFWYLYFECWNLGLMFISTTNLWDITLLRGCPHLALKWWMILLLAGVTPAEKLLEMYHGPWGQCVDPVFEELLYWNIEGDWNFPVCFSSAFLHAKFSSTCSFSLLKNRTRKREKVMVIYFTVWWKKLFQFTGISCDVYALTLRLPCNPHSI